MVERSDTTGEPATPPRRAFLGHIAPATRRPGHSRGPRQALATLGPTGVPGHTGVGGTWRMIARVSRELGRPCRFHRDCRLELRLTNSRLIHSSVPS